MTLDPEANDTPQIPIARRSEPTMLTVSDELLRERVREAVAEARQPPWWQRILSGPLTSVIAAGLIGAWLTSYYDHQRLKTENELIKSRAASERIEAQRELEIARAFATFEGVSKLMDRRLWRARRLVWAVDENITGDELERRWITYREAVNEWNENLNGNLARIERYFGAASRGTLEGPISDGLRAVNAELQARALSSKNLHARLDDLNNKMYAFNLHLLGMVESGNVGAFQRDS